MDFYCEYCQERVTENHVLINRNYVHCPACGSVLKRLDKGVTHTAEDNRTIFRMQGGRHENNE